MDVNDTPRDGKQFPVTDPLAYTPSPDITDYFMLEFRSRLKAGIQITGQKVKLLQRLWEGAQCTCWDDVRKQSDSTCLSCYGTGFIGGYHAPQEIYASFANIAVKQLVIQDYGIRKIVEPKAWSLWEPVLSNKDIIVNQRGERFWINNVSPTYFRELITRQQFDTELIENTNVIYHLDVGPFYLTTAM